MRRIGIDILFKTIGLLLWSLLYLNDIFKKGYDSMFDKLLREVSPCEIKAKIEVVNLIYLKWFTLIKFVYMTFSLMNPFFSCFTD